MIAPFDVLLICACILLGIFACISIVPLGAMLGLGIYWDKLSLWWQMRKKGK